VTSAELWLWEKHAPSCTAKIVEAHKITEDWLSDVIWPGPGFDEYTTLASVNVAKGYSGCAADWIALIGGGLKDTVAAWVTGSTNFGLLVKAQDESDTTAGELGWKKYDSWQTSGSPGTHAPYLKITYNRAPNPPALQSPADNFT
jgi:hypothetical protein